MAYTVSITNITKNESLLEVDVLFQDGLKEVNKQYKLARNDLDLVNFKRTLLEQKLALEEIDASNTPTGEVDLTGVTLTPPDEDYEVFEKKLLRLIKIKKLIEYGIVNEAAPVVASYITSLEDDLKATPLNDVVGYLDQIEF